MVAPVSLCVISSSVGGLYCSLMMALFKLLGSRQMWRFPFGFMGYVIEFTHSVGFVTGVMMPCSPILPSSFTIFSWYSIGVFHTGCCTSGTLGSVTLWYSLQSYPRHQTAQDMATSDPVHLWLVLGMLQHCSLQRTVVGVWNDQMHLHDLVMLIGEEKLWCDWFLPW